MIFIRDRYTRASLLVPLLYTLCTCILAGISSGSFAKPAQYEYKFVVTRVGMWCIWFVLTSAEGATCPRPRLIQIKYITPSYGCVSINCKLKRNSQFAINRFSKLRSRLHNNTVRQKEEITFRFSLPFTPKRLKRQAKQNPLKMENKVFTSKMKTLKMSIYLVWTPKNDNTR